ncbi:hypothetical protein fugu_003762 [Takifugu bimaculatus]|uniref:Large ribosomal subunit protein mL40 n=1 Tax=Takifugu bimaculatus TaxID=433685 RepID=A0A4Z2BD12_9TELE|nr:hypothetical protein fugu_003762 [Takifugu bimaculatus]
MALSRCLSCFSTRQTASSIFLFGEHHHAARSLWFAPVMTIKTSAALRAEPKKKKKVDPRREQIAKDRLKKKLKKLEKVAPELIPIEDFLTPTKFLDETRSQHMAEVQAVENALEAQREALEELKLESEELYRAALKPDLSLFPFTHEGPVYTPPNPKYEAPDGKYNDITRVYTQ